MRLQSLLLAALASSTGLATPLRRDVKQPIYNLRLTSSVPSLNGAYLSVKGTLLGVSAGAPPSARVQVYAVSNPATGLSELRTVEAAAAVPNPPSDGSSSSSSSHKTLALVGKDGLLDLASLGDPAAATAPLSGTVDWTSFRLDEQGRQVTYAGGGAGGGDGRWVVFSAGDGGADWAVKWKGADAWTTQDYMPVQVVYELV